MEPVTVDNFPEEIFYQNQGKSEGRTEDKIVPVYRKDLLGAHIFCPKCKGFYI